MDRSQVKARQECRNFGSWIVKSHLFQGRVASKHVWSFDQARNPCDIAATNRSKIWSVSNCHRSDDGENVGIFSYLLMVEIWPLSTPLMANFVLTDANLYLGSSHKNRTVILPSLYVRFSYVKSKRFFWSPTVPQWVSGTSGGCIADFSESDSTTKSF